MKEYKYSLFVLVLMGVTTIGYSQSSFGGYLTFLIRVTDGGSPVPQFRFCIEDSGLEGAVKNTDLTIEGMRFLEARCTDDLGYSFVHVWTNGGGDGVSPPKQRVRGKIVFTFKNGVRVTSDISETMGIKEIATDSKSMKVVNIDLTQYKKFKPSLQHEPERKNPFKE
ncbi:MAG: hypothetical protein P1U89_27670 [Verrucomicrobiales bacterium]|nr:hypothetical protein [Verrucomicrobiales bacterium]